jgi:small-conductance mechanosensitive channel
MTDHESVPVEDIRRSGDVRAEMQRASLPEDTGRPRSKRARWLTTAAFAAGAAVLGALTAALDAGAFALDPSTASRISQFALAAALTSLLLCVHSLLLGLIGARVDSKSTRFNLTRVLHLAVTVAIFLAVGSVFFANWYATAVSLGLVSLILGFALQAPITSFFGWIYILVRKPYRVGDRIKIDGATGDVIDVGYLDTTLWEFGGDLLTTDHPSGRIIKFPNSQVFSTHVYNYSWPLFPYVWNEIKLQVAYETDLEFVTKTMLEVVEEHRGTAMAERVRTYREILADTAVDHLQVQEKPTVLFRPNDYTWLDAIVRYLVDPRRSGTVKSELVGELLERLNAAPDRVLFPRSNAR